MIVIQKGKPMGHSQVDKVETHRKIVRTAARKLRERGLFGIGVAELMKASGLTVGGFYKHFPSREAFVAEVVASIDGTWQKLIEDGRAASKSDEQIVATLVDSYLSERHRDAPGSGCLFAAVGGDLAKADSATRTVATEKLGRAFELLASLFPDKRKPRARAAAIVTFSALLGALTFARLVDDEALSSEILTTVSSALKTWSRSA